MRKYVGKGEVGLVAAAATERRRQLNAQLRSELAEGRRQDEQKDVLNSVFYRQADLLARASLLTLGYQQHDRGLWRRRRGVSFVSALVPFEPAAKPRLQLIHNAPDGELPMSIDPAVAAMSLDDIQPFVKRAQQGDASALPVLRQFLDNHPEIWREAGDLARHAVLCATPKAYEKDLVMRECVDRKLAEHRVELEGSRPTKVERMLVDRVLVCWLQVHFADMAAAEVQDRDQDGPKSVYAQKRLDSANRRYLLALRQLAATQSILARACKGPPPEDMEAPLPNAKPVRRAERTSAAV